ncbi:MAG: hypothetical protein OXN84_06005 [Albidovulum sp.]|nr:hypothetical protein [Albidovulum sp.]
MTEGPAAPTTRAGEFRAVAREHPDTPAAEGPPFLRYSHRPHATGREGAQEHSRTAC